MNEIESEKSKGLFFFVMFRLLCPLHKYNLPFTDFENPWKNASKKFLFSSVSINRGGLFLKSE